MKNAQFSANDIKKCCQKKHKVGISFKGTKEFNGWFKENGQKICRITIPMGRKKIGPKTYNSMAKQLKLTINQFDNLLECPLNRIEYIDILKNKGILTK